MQHMLSSSPLGLAFKPTLMWQGSWWRAPEYQYVQGPPVVLWRHCQDCRCTHRHICFQVWRLLKPSRIRFLFYFGNGIISIACSETGKLSKFASLPCKGRGHLYPLHSWLCAPVDNGISLMGEFQWSSVITRPHTDPAATQPYYIVNLTISQQTVRRTLLPLRY